MATFSYIPVIQSAGAAQIRAAVVEGVSTAHGTSNTDDGRLYADVVVNGANYDVDVYDDFDRDGPNLVMSGRGVAGEWIPLESENDSDLTGRVMVDGGGAQLGAVLIVTFATDPDVYRVVSEITNVPGYDVDEGLAAFHSLAMREILTNRLPAAVPKLYEGKRISAFNPYGSSDGLPALGDIHNAEGLRAAHASLVKALSAEQSEHVEEWADIALSARARFESEMQSVRDANILRPDETELPVSRSRVQFAEFHR